MIDPSAERPPGREEEGSCTGISPCAPSSPLLLCFRPGARVREHPVHMSARYKQDWFLLFCLLPGFSSPHQFEFDVFNLAVPRHNSIPSISISSTIPRFRLRRRETPYCHSYGDYIRIRSLSMNGAHEELPHAPVT